MGAPKEEDFPGARDWVVEAATHTVPFSQIVWDKEGAEKRKEVGMPFEVESETQIQSQDAHEKRDEPDSGRQFDSPDSDPAFSDELERNVNSLKLFVGMAIRCLYD